jgi:hypothetical protein
MRKLGSPSLRRDYNIKRELNKRGVRAYIWFNYARRDNNITKVLKRDGRV